jgi:hypothetical protein
MVEFILASALVAIVLLVAFILIGITCCIILEYKDFNKGVCPKCGKKWKTYCMNSQGGRGYCCPDCDQWAWVSYPFIDNNF